MNCPKCGSSDMWDNRLNKKNPKSPDWKCKDVSCGGVIWPERGAKASGNNIAQAVQQATVKTLDLVPYGDPLPGKHGSPAKLPAQGLGSTRGDTSWLDELFNIYSVCHGDAGQYSTDPAVQAQIAATLFIAASRSKP